MEIKSAVSMTSGQQYRPPQPQPTSSEVEGEQTDENKSRHFVRAPTAGDSLVALSRSADAAPLDKNSTAYLQYLCRNWRLGRNAALGLFWVSLLLFALFIVQPLFVLLFSLGTCVTGNCDEWIEFTAAIGAVSVVPGVLALLGGAGAAFAHLRTRLSEQQLQKALEKEKSMRGVKLPRSA